MSVCCVDVNKWQLDFFHVRNPAATWMTDVRPTSYVCHVTLHPLSPPPPALGRGRSHTTGPALPRPAMAAARRGPAAAVAAATAATAATAAAEATAGATAGTAAAAAAGAAARAGAGAAAGAAPAVTTVTTAAAAMTAPASEHNRQQEGQQTQAEEKSWYFYCSLVHGSTSSTCDHHPSLI